MLNYRFVYHLISDKLSFSNTELLNSFSHYSEISERNTNEMYVHGIEFQVDKHFVIDGKRQETSLNYYLLDTVI